MPSILEQIDTAPKDNTIQKEELTSALKTDFFDNTQHIDDIKKDLDNCTDDITATLATTLEDCRDEINAKNTKDLTPDEAKILDLCKKLLPAVSVEKKNEVIDYGKLPDTQYLDAIAINIGKTPKEIKNLLIKNVDFRKYDENTIPLLTIADVSTFLNVKLVDISTYDPQIQDMVVFNIQKLLLEWNAYCHDKTGRTNKGSLQTVEGELHFYQKVEELYKKVSSKDVKKNILAGTYDIQTICKPYKKEVSDMVFGQIVSELFDENGKNIKNIYKNWKENSPMWKFVQAKAEANLSKQNLYNSLYYGYIQDKLQGHLYNVYVDKNGKELAINDTQYETNYKNNASINKLQLIKFDATYTGGLDNFLSTTSYGKSLIDMSKTYAQQKEDEPYLLENQKNIKKFSDTLTKLENDVRTAKNNYDRFLAPQLFATGSNESYQWAANTKKAKEAYEDATKQLAIKGNEAFVDMLLRLHDKGLSPELKPYFDALNGGVNYRGPKKMRAPIGGADFILDFSNRSIDGIATNRESYIKNNIANIVRDSGWEKTCDAIGDIVTDIQNHPDKFLVEVGSIVGAGIVAGVITVGSGGTAVVAAAGIFTVTENLLRSTGMGILEESKGGNFGDGFEEAIGTKIKNPDGSYQSIGWTDFALHKSFEFGTNIVLFGPVGKVGGVVEKTVLKGLESEISLKTTQSLITKMGLEKVGAKTIGLFTEAGFFTGFNAVSGSLQQGFSQESWDKAMKVENLASGFVHNLIFISALKAGNFLASPLQQHIIDSKLLKASELGTKDVIDKQKLLENELKNLQDTQHIKLEKRTNPDGTENLIWTKDGKEIHEDLISSELSTFNNLNKQLLDAQNILVQTQMTIAQKTDAFLQEPDVTAYNTFVEQNKLVFETLTPENVIDQRIKYFKAKKDTKNADLWEGKKKEYKELQNKYNLNLQSYADGTMAIPAAEQTILIDTPTTVETHTYTVDTTPIIKIQNILITYIDSIPDLNNEHRQVAEKMKKDIDGILSGDVTFDNYVGIRNLKSKASKLNIETDMLPLVQKILENTKNKYPNNPEKRDIQKLIDVDGILATELGMDVSRVDLITNVTSSIDYLKKPDFSIPEGFLLHSETNPIFNNIMGNVKIYIDTVKDGSYISPQEKQTLLLASSKFIEYALDSGLPIAKDPQQIFDMLQTNLKKLMYQDIKDRWYLSGSDHGILHIVNGDMFAAIGMIESLPDILHQEKLMVLQMITDHDLGYTLSSFDDMINNGSLQMFFNGTKDHPIYSRIYTESMRPQYEAIFGKENVDIMFQAMLDHSDIHTTDIMGLSKGGDRKALLQGIISNADCLGVTHVDKTPALYLENPAMMGLLQKIQNLHDVFSHTDLPEGDRLAMANSIKTQMVDYIRGLKLDPQKEQSFLNAIDKTIDPSHVGFSIGFNYSSFAYSFEKVSLIPGGIQVNMGLNTKMFNAVAANFGEGVALNNLNKVMGDYGLSHDTIVTVNGKESRYGDMDKKALFDLMQSATPGSEILFRNKKGDQVSDFILTVKEPGNNEQLADMVDKGKNVKEAFTKAVKGLDDYAKTFDIVKYNKMLQSIIDTYDIGISYDNIKVDHLDDTIHHNTLKKLMTGYGAVYDANVLSVVH